MDDLLKPFMADLKACPLWIKWAAIVMTCAATIPLALIFRARTSYSDKPKIHIIQNMDNQPKFVSQEANSLFLDGRAMRPLVDGTISQTQMTGDTHLYMGLVKDSWADSYPASITVNRAFVERGQERFNIYCAPCHGKGGFGDGVVHHRAQRLLETGINGTTWVAPKNLHEDAVASQKKGQLFNSITNGIRTMAAYGSQISVDDRWAIVAYIEALQISQNANPKDVEDADTLPHTDGSDEGSNK